MIFLCRFLKILHKRWNIITREMFEESESERERAKQDDVVEAT